MRVVVSWSSGKDSALALYAAKRWGLEVKGLLTTADVSEDVVTGHRVEVELVRSQARSAGLPLYEVRLPSDLPPLAEYESVMSRALAELREKGIEGVVYGDIFQRDMIEYKQDFLRRLGLEAVYPLYGLPSALVVESSLSLGFKIIVATDASKSHAICEEMSWRTLRSIPAAWDIAGEYGEYHTFVIDGPIFAESIRVKTAGKERRGGKLLCRLRLATGVA